MPTVSAYVEVDLADFDEDDLVDELESRGYRVIKNTAEEADTNLIDAMLYAFKLGNEERAMRLAKELVQDATGRIL